MEFLRRLILLVLILALTGCTSRIVKIEQPGTPVVRPGYTIYSPKEDGWFFLEYENSGKHVLSFAKPQEETDHTLYANVEEVPSFAKFKNPEEFFTFFKNAMEIGYDPRRFNKLEEEIKLEKKFGDYTIAHYSKVEDHGAVQQSGVPFLVMETYGYYFIHPGIENLIVNVAYSERAKSVNLDRNFKIKAMDFINGLKIKQK